MRLFFHGLVCVSVALVFPIEREASARNEGDVAGEVAGRVDDYYGSMGASSTVAVPSYHGVEPELILDYDAWAPNRPMGVGGTLKGFPTVERASAGRGAPNYNSSDIFLLAQGDAKEELMVCATGSTSPSCTTCPTGSTCYSTKRDNFTRIRN